MAPLLRLKPTIEKTALEELAICGGKPLFIDPLHVGAPNLGNQAHFMRRMADILNRNWLTNGGPFVTEFESRIAHLTGVKHCIATSNGTLALELAARALGLKGEVIVPSFTFVATAHALKWQEISPVFCDIEAQRFTLDPKKVEALITPRTTGILAVHLWGRSCDTEALADIAEKHGLKLLYDASHALGCTHNGVPIGQFGDAEVFSFHATKFINTFEGGAIVTNNDDLAIRLRLMKNFGFTGTDKVNYLGINGKMSEPSAAMGITSLESIDKFISINQDNYHAYAKHSQRIKGLEIIPFLTDENNNYQYITFRVNESATGISRDNIVRALHSENVLARRYFHPGVHQMEPYQSEEPNIVHLPVTEAATHEMICLPTGSQITPNTVKSICKLLRLIIRHGQTIQSNTHHGNGQRDRAIPRLSELDSH